METFLIMLLKHKFHKGQILENVQFHDISAEGLCIGRTNDNIVVFAENVVPGDVANVKIIKVKGSYLVSEPVQITQYSAHRTQPFCKHFSYCGGCKWQHLNYDAQLLFKKKFVYDALTRIGNLTFPEMQEPLKSPKTQYYRNKLEFTFSNNRWIEPEFFSKENKAMLPALGFHKSGNYDKVLDIHECFLQDDLSNQIRNFVRDYALKHHIEFFDIKKHTGILRTLTIRNTTLNEWMVILGVYELKEEIIFPLLDELQNQFPIITSLYYAHLFSANESLNNGKLFLYKGKNYITEKLGNLQFRISPNSFFQTNPLQTQRMYDLAKELAQLSGNEIVYDLYCGTGTIGIYLADKTKKVVGIEYVSAAVEDACINTQINNIHNITFFAGDIAHLLNDEFVNTNGKPDVIITDPPRAGMHKNVIQQIRKIAPKKIVYISCSPPSQARDISFLSDMYDIKFVQPIDMFPHTTHAENIVLMELKKQQ